MDDFNRIFEKAKQIEVQLSDEKKNHKETKLKYNDLVSQNEVEKKNVLSLRREKEELIRNYDEKAKKLEEEINFQLKGLLFFIFESYFIYFFKEKVTISKDLMIKNLEIKMGELSEKIEESNDKNLKLKEENESLKLVEKNLKKIDLF